MTIRLDRRFRGPLINAIIDNFGQAPFHDFLLVELDRKLENYSTRNGFESQLVDTLENAEQTAWLDELLEKLRTKRPDSPLATLVDRIFAAHREGLNWYVCQDPAHVRFVGQIPFVDRNRIRTSIANLEGASLNTVLLVKGQIGSGKSYLWNYIRYLNRGASQHACTLIDLDDNPEVHSVNDKLLMMKIFSKLGLGALASYDESAQSLARHETLIGQLISRVQDKPQDRFIVIDSLDNKSLTVDGLKLLETLTVEIGRGNVPGVRIVLMGYESESPIGKRSNVHIIREDIEPIGQSEIERFFQDVADEIDAQLDPSIARAAAARAIDLTQEREENQLHDQIARIASELFGGAEAEQ